MGNTDTRYEPVLKMRAILAVVVTFAVTGSASARTKQDLKSYGKPPLAFEPNQGQVNAAVKFLSRGNGYTLFLTPAEAVLALMQAGAKKQGRERPDGPGGASAYTNATLRMELVGAKHGSRLEGVNLLPGKANYLIGKDSTRWRRNIPSYARVRQQGVYPGIDLVYYGNDRQLEYDFIVSPGADPEVIGLAFHGAERAEIDTEGNLVLRVGSAEARFLRPVVYQERNGTRAPIAGSYRINENGKVGFRVGTYDPAEPLIIDPVLIYSTYLGGTGHDGNIPAFGFQGAIGVDAAGHAYVTGFTPSIDFPTTAYAKQPAYGGGTRDGYLAMLNAAGSAIVYSTYLGGSGNDQSGFIALDSLGDAYVIGWTDSTNFPTVNAYQPILNGPADLFVAKIGEPVLNVVIDIKPGSFPNSINLGATGTVPVAILSTADFDATTVEPTTVTIASAPVRLKGKGTAMAAVEDVNGDGRSDLVVHVSTETLQLSEIDAEANLEGRTSSGLMIKGSDSVRVVP